MKSKTLKSLMLTFAMSATLFGSSMTALAANPGDNSTIADYIESKGGNLSSGVSGSFKTYNDAATMHAQCDVGYNYYSYTNESGQTVYYAIKADDEETVSGRITNLTTSQAQTGNMSKDVLGGFEVGADTATATGLLSGFVAPVSVLLGIITFCVTLGMTVFTAFDLCYIAFPVFRGKCDDKKVSGGFGTKQGSDGTTKLTFITDDAQHAVIAADTVQSGKSPFVIYLKERSLSFILLAIVIFILMTGNIGIFATLALKLVQGILDFLNTFK